MAEGTCTSEVVEDAARAQELLELWRQAGHVAVLALPGLDQAKLVQDAFGSCLLLRQGTQVWRVSLNHMEDGVWPPALWQEAVLRSLGITVPA